jgi:hypothetical protein
MKSKTMHFDDDIQITSKDYLALILAAIQIVMPYVLGFMFMFCVGVYLLLKFWLRQ